MKLYPINKNERAEYIIDYKKDNDNLIIIYADKHQSIIPYSPSEEQKVLETIENQIKNGVHMYPYMLWEISDNKRLLKLWTLIGGIAGLVLVGITGVAIMAKIYALLIVSGFIGIAIPEYIVLYQAFKSSLKQAKNNLEDFEKCYFFVNNKDDFSKTKLTEEKALDGVSKETVKFIKSANIEELNIANVESIPAEDLRQIHSNITGPTLKMAPIKRKSND